MALGRGSGTALDRGRAPRRGLAGLDAGSVAGGSPERGEVGPWLGIRGFERVGKPPPAREPGQITADDILRAVPIADDGAEAAFESPLLSKVVHPALAHALSNALCRISVETLARSAVAALHRAGE